MKMCQRHWDALRAAVAARGLDALVPDSGEQAASNLASEIEQGPSIDNFDPLMGAHNAIASNVLGLLHHGAALDLMTHDLCPLCYVNEAHEAVCTEDGCTFTYDAWIDRAADDALAEWHRRGSLPTTLEGER